MSPATLAQAITEQHNMVEVMMERPYHQALGYLLSSPPIVWMGPGRRSFGHHGVGGSIGLGDPDAKVGFCLCHEQDARAHRQRARARGA